jgi:hypothetical protein
MSLLRQRRRVIVGAFETVAFQKVTVEPNGRRRASGWSCAKLLNETISFPTGVEGLHFRGNAHQREQIRKRQDVIE